MTGLEYEIATMKLQLDYLIEFAKKSSAEETKPKEPLPEFITLKLAAELKGGAALNTYKSRYYLQPCGGTKSINVGGKKCWKREDVISWLTVDDAELPTYLKQFGVTIKKY